MTTYIVISQTYLDIMDMLKQITAVIAHRQVKGAVEAALLLTQPTHLMVPWSTYDTQYSGAALHCQIKARVCSSMHEYRARLMWQRIFSNMPLMSSIQSHLSRLHGIATSVLWSQWWSFTFLKIDIILPESTCLIISLLFHNNLHLSGIKYVKITTGTSLRIFVFTSESNWLFFS